ncbi:MAG: hypothetical protein E2586_09795 [Novosphingobium sp.]|uniref:hypothetical protein n=1 Tax=Novosphingobium sp. TaxID=1874826 RepID=UPI0012BF5282|nr:hypothetical protein [Novosphingobium sp.]MPS68777.1 hypothetical protein [Novosphingobium sp.]
MVEEFSEVRRNITAFLMSLRQSVDRPFRGRAPTVDEQRERFMRTMMIVEEARIRFNTYTRYREEPTKGEWDAARKELLSFVDTFAHADFVDPDVYDRPFIFRSAMPRDRERPSAFIKMFSDRENRVPVSDALVSFRNYIESTGSGLAETQGSLSLEDLDRIVPRQQVAPVQFDIVDGRIIVASREPKTDEADRANIQSALEHIRGSGEQLLNNLANSNCDRRLLESVSELDSQLISEGNVVKIGLTNMACGVMGVQFQAELPDAIAGMLNAYNASISLYVAQFPEWEQFTQKASLIDLDEDDVAEVDIAAGEVIAALTENAALADPEVPKTIAFVRQFLAFPGASSKRAAFAMIRTIENLVSSIVRHSLNFFTKTAENLVDAGSKAASKVIIGLLGLALMSAAGIGTAAMRAGAPWVKQAAEIVQKQIEKATAD